MERISTKYIKVILMTIGIVITLLISCNNKMEPEFNIYGNSQVLTKVKVNIEMLKEENIIEIKTLFFNGNIFEINNKDVSRYHIYISYDDLFIESLEFDNFHELEDNPKNDIYIREDNGFIYVSYVGLDELKEKRNEKLLIPIDTYFAGQSRLKKETDFIKFTKLYK